MLDIETTLQISDFFKKLSQNEKKMTEKWPVSSIYTNNIFIWVQVD